MRDAKFENYTFRGSVTVAELTQPDPPSISAARPEKDREKYSKAHWQEDQSSIATTTVGEHWAYRNTGSSPLGYSSDPDQPLITDDRVVFLKSEPKAIDVNYAIVAGQHPVLALGLGALMDPQVRHQQGGWQLTGHLAARGEVVATFSDLRDSTLTRLEITHGTMRKVYDYGKFETVRGVEVPKSVKYKLLAKGNELVRASYDIFDVDTATRSLPKASPWFRPGFTVEDQRVSPIVAFSYAELVKLNAGQDTLTASKLLEFSKAKAKAQEDAARHSPLNQRAQSDRVSATNPILWTLPAVIILALGILIAKRFSQRKNA